METYLSRAVGIGLAVMANAAILAGLQLDLRDQHRIPAGDVQITELDAPESSPQVSNYSRLLSDRRV